MDGLSIVSAISGVLVGTVKTAEKCFEITAVDEQAKALLQTCGQVSGQLNDARALRRQKSSLFTAAEKRIFEESFKHTDDAIKKVAMLAEAPRADMCVSKGKEKGHKERVRLNTRLLFVLRDSPNIQVCLTQLGIASQSLNSTLVTLMGREGRSRSLGSAGGLSDGGRPPPSYEETMFLNARRQRNISRRISGMSLNSQNQPSPAVSPSEEDDIQELGGVDRERPPIVTASSVPELSRSSTTRTYQDNEFLSASRTRNSQRRARSDLVFRPTTPLATLPQVPESMSELPGNEAFDEDDTRSVFTISSVSDDLYSGPQINVYPGHREGQPPRRGELNLDRYGSATPYQAFSNLSLGGFEADQYDSAAPHQFRSSSSTGVSRVRSRNWMEARCR